MNKKRLIPGIVLLLGFFLWIGIGIPFLDTTLPKSLNLSLELFSVDNFYDSQEKEYEGEQTSKSLMSYESINNENGALTVNNTFDVRTIDDEPIISLKRVYGIDQKTGKHIVGYGDRDRDGFLFAPPGVQKDHSFRYWHINYDAPAQMNFVGEDELFGLKTYIFESNYEGYQIDQTDSLTHLPGVPETYGIVVEPNLRIWVEPNTGYLVKYEDNAIAYYYDVDSGDKAYPWNAFQNRVRSESVQQQVSLVQARRFTQILQRYVVSVTLLVASIVVFLSALRSKKNKDSKSLHTKKLLIINLLSMTVTIGGLVVIVGWLLDIKSLQSVVPGLVTMKFTTALSFVFSGVVVLFAARFVDGRRMGAHIVLPISSMILFIFMIVLIVSVLLGINSGLELMFVQESTDAILSTAPGRPSIGTIVAFLLIATVGLITLLEFRHKMKMIVLSGYMVFLIAAIALFGYVFDWPPLYYALNGISTAMAFHTSLFFLLISIGIIQLTKLDIHKEDPI